MCAHTKAPQRENLQWETQRAVKRPRAARADLVEPAELVGGVVVDDRDVLVGELGLGPGRPARRPLVVEHVDRRALVDVEAEVLQVRRVGVFVVAHRLDAHQPAQEVLAGPGGFEPASHGAVGRDSLVDGSTCKE